MATISQHASDFLKLLCPGCQYVCTCPLYSMCILYYIIKYGTHIIIHPTLMGIANMTGWLKVGRLAETKVRRYVAL